MYKLLIALLVVVSFGSYAEVEKTSCEKLEHRARLLMELRQMGRPMVKVLSFSKNKIWRTMVIDAYKTPKFNGSEYKEREVEEFATKYFIYCLGILEK